MESSYRRFVNSGGVRVDFTAGRRVPASRGRHRPLLPRKVEDRVWTIAPVLQGPTAVSQTRLRHLVSRWICSRSLRRCFVNSLKYLFDGVETHPWQDAASFTYLPGTVAYNVKGFLDKNNDLLFRDLKEAMSSASGNSIVQEVFPRSELDMKKRPETAATQFKTSVNRLIGILMSKEPSYIRCIKPNDFKKAREFIRMKFSFSPYNDARSFLSTGNFSYRGQTIFFARNSGCFFHINLANRNSGFKKIQSSRYCHLGRIGFLQKVYRI